MWIIVKMGKACTCCGTEECCLCDKAWGITTWSVDVLGQNFNGQFLPLEKPDPFTRENACNSRIGDDCVIKEPVLIDDCREESDWFDLSYSPCCPQCICTGYVNGGSGLVYGYCEILGLLNYEFSYKGVTHTRTWQQESYYGTAQMYQCCDTNTPNKTRFGFDLYYYAVRFSAQSQQGYTRYRTVAWDCLYDPPNDQATAPDNLIRGEWIQPVEVGVFPPCMPCSWSRSTFFGNCEVIEGTECPPCEYLIGPLPGVIGDISCSGRTGGAVSLRSIGLIFGCNFTFSGFGILDPDEERICRVTDQYKYGMRTINVFSSSGDEFCLDATIDIDPRTKVNTFLHRFISECYDCDKIPLQIRLNRVTGFPTNAPITQYVFPGGSFGGASPCANFSPLEKIIPPYITMSLV